MNVSPFPFAPGVYPALLCRGSVTTLAYKAEGLGLVRYQWLDGDPNPHDRQVLDVNCVTKAHAKLSYFGQARHCAYFVDQGSKMYLANVNIDAPSSRIYYALELKGNDPIAWWGDELYAQVESGGYRILRAPFPIQPYEDMGPGAATGIAWVDDDTGVPALWDTVQPPAFPHGYQFSHDGAVWVTPDDQIMLQIGSAEGTLQDSPRVFNPVIAKQQNGRFVVAAWTRTSAGPGPLYVAADISQSDLIPIAPPSNPPGEVDPPDPPDPPEPEPPQESPVNIYLLENKDTGDDDIYTLKLLGEKVPTGGPNGEFGIKKPNGRYLTLTPSQTWEERDAILGHWEKFYPGKPSGTVAPRHDPPNTFWLKTVEGA